MAGLTQNLEEFEVISRYFPNSGKVIKDCLMPVVDTGRGEPQLGFLDSLPVRQIKAEAATVLTGARSVMGSRKKYFEEQVD